MNYSGVLLVSGDLERTKRFYSQLFGLRMILDYGANITLTGGISFQSLESWADFIGKEPEAVHFQHHSSELYFEEEDLDGFLAKLKEYQVPLVHEVKTFDWGQRGIRVYDPDGHIIEVGEPMYVVVKRFLDQGLSVKETSKASMISEKMIQRWIKTKWNQ